ncbi:MAG: hypothetical protein ACFHWX_23210 [Bacteroidota bacterium]
MTCKICVLLIILIITISPGDAQVLLFHKKQHREAFYRVGEVLSFSTRTDASRKDSQILGFEGDTLIVFQNYTINPREVTCLYVDDKTRGWNPLRVLDKVLLIAGVGYPLLEYVNEGLIHRGEPDSGTLVVGGILIGASFLPRWLISDKIRIKGGRKLVIIDSR